MNFVDINPKMSDMLLDNNILSSISVINDLKIPILLNINDTISQINSKDKIIDMLQNNPIKILFRLPKIQNNKTNFTEGKNFEVILNIDDINKFSFKKHILENKEINNFYYQHVKKSL